jgi:flavodoxin
MRVLFVYDSVYGNTEIIARAIGESIPGEVPVLRVDQIDPRDLAAADLLILGTPTHGAEPTVAIQGLIRLIGSPANEGAKLATFDTRLAWRILERWGGFAAPKMATALEAQGWTLAADPEGFIVKGLRKGPLRPGEAERAAEWAKTLVEGQTLEPGQQ